MPQIPLIQAQSLVQAPDLQASPSAAAGRFASAVDNLAENVARTQDAQRRRAEEEARALAQRQQHDEAMVAVTNSVSQEQMTSMQSAVDAANSGSMAGFTDQWRKDFDQRATEAAKAIPPVGKALYQEHIAELRARLSTSFYEKEMGARNAQLTRTASDGIETDANTAFIDPSQAANILAYRRATIGALGIPEAEKAQLIDKAGQTIAYSAGVTLATNNPAGFLQRVGVGAKNPAAAAAALNADPVLSQLKPENLQRLTQHAQTLLAQQQAAAQRNQDQAERVANESYNRLVTFVNTGASLDLNYVAEVSRDTAGTSLQGPAQALLTRATTTAGFGALPLPRQEQALASMDAQFSAKGTNPDDQAMLASLRTIHGQQVQAYKDNPWQAANRFAHIPAQPETPITAPEGALAVIAQRKPLMSSVETAAGGPVSPMQPAEASQWAGYLSALSVPQRSDLLARAGEGLTGGQLNALADQIAAKDKPTALMLKLNDRTGAGRAVAEFVGRGAQGLADKRVKADDTTQGGWRSEIAGMIRGTLGNTAAENDAIDAAFYTRAAFELPDTTMPGYASQTASNEHAVEMVIGHPIERGGVKTILPRGMDESTFDAKLRAMTPDVLKVAMPDGQAYVNGTPIPLNLLHNRLVDYGMRYYSPGVYAPVRGNAIVTTDKAASGSVNDCVAM